MVEVGKNTWKSFGSMCLLKQGHSEEISKDPEYLQGRSLHNLPGQLVTKGDGVGCEYQFAIKNPFS